ncbi:MAG: hypothetical protein ABI878_11655 [Acidobacteriota bacterium]
MFYRPDFCCGCGEKIERTEWKFWSSTRFCDACSSEHPVIEIGPKVLIGVGILAASLGVGSWMKGSPNSGPAVARQNLVSQANPPAAGTGNLRTTDVRPDQSQQGSSVENASVSRSAAPASNSKAGTGVSEPVYSCGAETKKGTPCTRKVKGNVRCWQHKGMPPMLPPDKLLISK